MSNSLAFFEDPGLTSQLSSLYSLQATDGFRPPAESVVYLGSLAVGTVFYAASSPGEDEVVVSIVDAASGVQVPVSCVSLALSAAGLDTATPGAPLALGLEIYSGAENAIAIHVRIDLGATGPGLYENLSIWTNETQEWPL